jgi:hypothetical protein
MESYDDGLTSFDVRNAIRFIKSIQSKDLYDQPRFRKRGGTVWLDDRTRDRLSDHEPSTAVISMIRPVTGLDTGRGSLEACETQHDAVISASSVTNTSIHNNLERPQGQRSITDAPVMATQAPQHTHSKVKSSYGSIPNGPRCTRKHLTPLTAHDLCANLREKRFDHTILADADRRLIWIADPDAYDLLALIKTATTHQRRSLQNAICKYLALRTSIKAMVIEKGYFSFQFEFHLPYFALRRSRLGQGFPDRKKRPHRGWMNLGFLDKDTDLEEVGVLGIHHAQISITICGTNNSRWVAYCFEDRHFDEVEETEECESTADYQCDKIARGELDAHTSIWDPREYFLSIVAIRAREIIRVVGASTMP